MSEPRVSEAELLQQIRLEFGRLKNGRLFRFNTGALKNEHGRLVKFGVPGFPDLAGILGPDGAWIGLEVKAQDGRVSEDQTNFHAIVKRFGGRIQVVKSIDEAREAMRGWGAIW